MVAKFVSTAALLTVLTAGAVQAQSGRAPAEVPPASFADSQYVDSNGCVFIRAGFNGRTTWVPRFGDDRQPMCGFTPSTAGGGSGEMTMAEAPAAAAPAPVTVRTVTTTTPRRAAAPVQTRPRQPVVAAARPAAPVAPQPQARVYQAQSGGALDRRWSHADITGPSPCTNYSAHSQLYAVPSPEAPNQPLRCGPQAVHPADALREQSPNGGQWVPWTGVTPAPDNNVYVLPPPYAPRWPAPYLHGASAPHPRSDGSTPLRSATRGTVTAAAHQQPAIMGHVSTMGTTAGGQAYQPVRAQPPGQMSNGRYIQVGTYGVPSNATTAIARLQSSGLPAARGQARRGGQVLQVVLAGPFSSQAELSAALGRARAMGYSDAFIR